MVPYFVYCISDPRTNTIFYVGQTKNTEQRFSTHMSSNNRAVEIKKAGYKPIFTVLFQCSYRYISIYENRFITYFEKQGYILDNVSSIRRRNSGKKEKLFTLRIAI